MKHPIQNEIQSYHSALRSYLSLLLLTFILITGILIIGLFRSIKALVKMPVIRNYFWKPRRNPHASILSHLLMTILCLRMLHIYYVCDIIADCVITPSQETFIFAFENKSCQAKSQMILLISPIAQFISLICISSLSEGWRSFHSDMPSRPLTVICLFFLIAIHLAIIYTEGTTQIYLVLQTTGVKIVALLIFFSGLIGMELLQERLNNYSRRIEVYRRQAEDRIRSSTNDCDEIYEAFLFIKQIEISANDRLAVVKTVTSIYSIMLVTSSLLSYTDQYVAEQELASLCLDIGVATVLWGCFCMDENGYGVWNLPSVAQFLRSEIDSDKHLAQSFTLRTGDQLNSLNETDVLDKTILILVEPYDTDYFSQNAEDAVFEFARNIKQATPIIQ